MRRFKPLVEITLLLLVEIQILLPEEILKILQKMKKHYIIEIKVNLLILKEVVNPLSQEEDINIFDY